MPCWYCGASLKGGKRTRDHVVPKSKGGRQTVDACRACNNRKADMSLEDFRKLLFEAQGGIGEFWSEKRERINKLLP